MGGSVTAKHTLPHRQLPLIVDIDILFAEGPQLTIGALVLWGKVPGELKHDDHFTIGLIGFHRLVSIADVVKREDLGGFRLENAFRRLINDFLHGNL